MTSPCDLAALAPCEVARATMPSAQRWVGAGACVVPSAARHKYGDAGACEALYACFGPQCARVMEREASWDALAAEAALVGHCLRATVCGLVLPPLPQVIDRVGAPGPAALADDGWVAVGEFDLYVCGNV